MTPHAAPILDDYPRALVSDGRRGAERRVTIDGMPLDEPLANSPLVTIVTVVFNNVRHIERAMASVFAQTYRNIEYIVVDGGSTDGTVEIVHRHAGRLSYWHSAKDDGIADAFNRGVALARGAVVGLVNSDDWLSPDQVAQGVAALQATGAPFVFGDLIYHRSDDGAPQYRLAGDPGYAGKLWHRMPQMTHPTALVRRQVYADHGVFDPAWKIGMDYDWLYRLHRRGVHGVHCRAILGHMSLGGVSDRGYIACLDEHRRIAGQHGSPAALLVPLYAFRRNKMRLRIAAEGLMSRRLMSMLRRLINPALREA